MIVYEITLKNYEPMLVASARHGRFMKHEVKYLPGSAIRGALLTLLKCLGSKMVQEEIEEPSIVFHPAYPVTSNGSQTRPAHPLIYRCKVCNQVVILSLKEVLENIDNFKVPIECGRGHLYAMESLGGRLVYQCNNELKLFRPSYIALDSIGINRVLRSTEVGLFYSYVALAPGHAFKGLIIDPSDKLRQLIEEVGLKLSGLELKIGRRGSAGFGGVKARISELKDYRLRLVEKVSGKGTICLLAKSPIFDLNAVEVDGETRILSLSEGQIKSLRNSRVKLVLKTGLAIASGFSLVSNTPKVRLHGLDIGSLIVLEGDPRIEDLVEVELMGIGPFSIAGFNIVEVMELA